MTPRASEKLEEAQFFLWHMKEEDQKTDRQWAEAFKYYLSAFLTAAASVVDTAIYQVRDAKLFKEWRDQLPPEDRASFDFMKGQRNFEVHGSGAETSIEQRAIALENVLGTRLLVVGPPGMFLSEEQQRRNQERGLPPWTQASTEMPKYYFNNIGKREEVLRACEHYTVLLQSFLQKLNLP